jgi:hypothetical protein
VSTLRAKKTATQLTRCLPKTARDAFEQALAWRSRGRTVEAVH